MLDYGTQATTTGRDRQPDAPCYYLSAVAVAIGFRMNLFNIGVDGQYQLAAMLAAAFGGAVRAARLPAPGRDRRGGDGWSAPLWAGIAGVLKVTRGVSEVISTIMLNSIAGVADRLPAARRSGSGVQTRQDIDTPSRSPVAARSPGST